MGAAFWFRCLLRLRRPILPRPRIRLGGLLLGIVLSLLTYSITKAMLAVSKRRWSAAS